MFGDKDGNAKHSSTGRGKDPAAPGKGATLIASNTRLEGDIHFSDELMVNGEICGQIVAAQDSEASLTVSAKGNVMGEIRVPSVIINGSVKGDIYASKRVELAAEARVEGNVYYHMIEMVAGARVDGSLFHTPPGEAPQRKNLAPGGKQEAPLRPPSEVAGGVGGADNVQS